MRFQQTLPKKGKTRWNRVFLNSVFDSRMHLCLPYFGPQIGDPMNRILLLVLLFGATTVFGQKTCGHRGLRVDFSDPNNARSDPMAIVHFTLNLDITLF